MNDTMNYDVLKSIRDQHVTWNYYLGVNKNVGYRRSAFIRRAVLFRWPLNLCVFLFNVNVGVLLSVTNQNIVQEDLCLCDFKPLKYSKIFYIFYTCKIICDIFNTKSVLFVSELMRNTSYACINLTCYIKTSHFRVIWSYELVGQLTMNRKKMNQQ